MLWWQRLIELVVITACLIAIRMACAQDPSLDDLASGGISGFVGFMISQVTSHFAAQGGGGR
jgi:hypothetical protein